MKKLAILLAVFAIFTTGCEDYNKLKTEGKAAGTPTANATPAKPAAPAKPATPAKPVTPKADTEIGLRTAGLDDSGDENLAFSNIKFSQSQPGESQMFERSFENAPPFVSHTMEDMLPITTDNNMCITCHMPDVAVDAGATPVPQSHLEDLRKDINDASRDLGGKLSQARFECVQCHIEQSDAKPLVGNSFQRVFRDSNASKRSNLADIIEQGAHTEF